VSSFSSIYKRVYPGQKTTFWDRS